ncbi:MAG: peptide deformylase [Bdellovibrionaceae bacterium]|nr:peptide deformylase [Pseudobdellovibrionaceae bacterium]
MVLEILKYPDPRLREKSQTVTEFGPDVEKFAKDLIETMYAESGIGLAAPQVGKLWNMLVIDCRPKENGRYSIEDMTELEQEIDQPLVIINPKIVAHKGKTTFDEGCLSVPSFFETVERHDYIELEYQDVKGNKKILKTDGLLAIVIQHEMDHLDGTLFIDRISFVKSNKIKNQIKKGGYPEKKRREAELVEVDAPKAEKKADKKRSRE